MTKRIWFDIGHLAQYNFYKESVVRLSREYSILITLIDRGRLTDIVRKELHACDNITIIPTTTYKYSRFSVYWDSNIRRFFILLKICRKFKPDLAISNGYLQGIVARLYNIPNVQFGDDPEAKDYYLKKFFANELYYAFYSDKKIKSFNALKEWAYLSPDYFKPNKEILTFYGLKEKEYIFLREVIVTSSNYVNQSANGILAIANDLEIKHKVVLSLEDKSAIDRYPASWKILEEPVEDIHSLIYFSALVVSTGDSMAREGAQLGVPSIYCGTRSMNAMEILKKKGILIQSEQTDLPETITKVLNKEIIFPDQEEIRSVLTSQWINIPLYIEEIIRKYL